MVTLKHMHPITLLDRYEELILQLERWVHTENVDGVEAQEIVSELRVMRDFILNKLS